MRAITKEDYFIGIQSPFRESKSAYNKAKKLTSEQIEKFVKAKNLIGYEVDVFYRGKNRKCIIVAVSLPDNTETTYIFNNGENTTYNSYPYDIHICIEDGKLESVWYNKIDNYNFENSAYKGVYFETHGYKHTIIK